MVLSVSFGILVITAGLFFFLPRTARAAFQHLVSHRYHLAGFSNHVTLGEIGEIKQENTPVMHVKMDHPEDRLLELKWRGAALAEFNGRAWFNRPGAGQILQPDRGELRLANDVERRAPGRFISYAVYLNELGSDALFFAGTPQFLRIDSAIDSPSFRQLTACNIARRVTFGTTSTAAWNCPPAKSAWKTSPPSNYRRPSALSTCNCLVSNPIRASMSFRARSSERKPRRASRPG